MAIIKLNYDTIEIINNFALGKIKDYEPVVEFNKICGYTLDYFKYNDYLLYSSTRFLNKKRLNDHELCSYSNYYIKSYAEKLIKSYTDLYMVLSLVYKIYDDMKKLREITHHHGPEECTSPEDCTSNVYWRFMSGGVESRIERYSSMIKIREITHYYGPEECTSNVYWMTEFIDMFNKEHWGTSINSLIEGNYRYIRIRYVRGYDDGVILTINKMYDSYDYTYFY